MTPAEEKEQADAAFGMLLRATISRPHRVATSVHRSRVERRWVWTLLIITAVLTAAIAQGFVPR